MKSHQYLLALLVLMFCVYSSDAQLANSSKDDGAIIERTPYTLPSFEQLSPFWTQFYTREAVEKMKASSDVELLRMIYMSDGLKIVGFINKPVEIAGKKLPAIIFCRCGAGEEAKISPQNFNYLAEMHRYTKEGFVVLATQYRGVDGGEGKDEAGGADTNDVMNLIPLARSLGYVDMDKLFMWGCSRGGMMTLQAIRRGAPIRAAVVVGAPTDLLSRASDPGFERFAREIYPDYEKRKDEHLKNRSAILWADQLNVPLLIVQGGADVAVSPRQAMALAQKMEEAGKLYELVIYAKDDHPVLFNAEDRLRRTIDWFKNPRTLSVSRVIEPTIKQQGVAAGIKQYHDLRKAKQHLYDFSEPELNRLGYQLLQSRLVQEAIEIFKLNVEMYPQAFNTYDSLGEAYLAAGDRDNAIKNYKRSVELNPQNTNGVNALKRIGQ
jgi:tetratricopeptide (TPR) repeat protein